MKELVKKASVLIEALPYIRNFYNKFFVIKYGGAAQLKEELKHTFAQDIVLLNYIGINTVIVHGGGPKITDMMDKLGKKTEFVQGQRRTDRETMDIVEMVLGGLINKEIVSLINMHGGRAVGLTGKDGNIIMARKKVLKSSSPVTETDELIDMGFVGEIETVDPDILKALDEKGFIPILAPVGVNESGESLNINADSMASSVAGAITAEKLILLTDVSGITDKDNRIISTLTSKDASQLISTGIITGGMLPKVKACLDALNEGVRKTHIIDGRVPHCLLLEIFTQEGIGTEIVL